MCFSRFADFQGRGRVSAKRDEYFFGSRHVYRAGYMRRQARDATRRDAARHGATRRAFLISQREPKEIIGADISDPNANVTSIALMKTHRDCSLGRSFFDDIVFISNNYSLLITFEWM